MHPLNQISKIASKTGASLTKRCCLQLRDGMVQRRKNRRRRKRDKKTSEVVATVREDEEGEGNKGEEMTICLK